MSRERHRQVPQGAWPIVLLLHGRQHSHQQRVRQAVVCLRCAVAAHPRPVHEAGCCHPFARAPSAKLRRTDPWTNDGSLHLRLPSTAPMFRVPGAPLALMSCALLWRPGGVCRWARHISWRAHVSCVVGNLLFSHWLSLPSPLKKKDVQRAHGSQHWVAQPPQDPETTLPRSLHLDRQHQHDSVFQLPSCFLLGTNRASEHRARPCVWHHLWCLGVERCTRARPGRFCVFALWGSGVCVMSGMLTTDSSVEVDHTWPRNLKSFRRPHIANRRICQCSATSSRLCWAYRTHNVQPATLALLDTGATRASCCALGEATRGHNSVVQVIQDAPPILWPFCRNSRTHSGTELRAADVLTSALQCSTSPSAPHAQEAGLDCTQTMAADNLGYHGPYLNTLHVQKIDYLSVGAADAGRHASVKHNLDGVLHGVVVNRKRRNLGYECWRKQSDVEAPWGQATNAASDGKTEFGTHRQPARTKQANNGPNSKRLGKLREWGETRHTGNQPKKEPGQCATRPGICTDHLKCQETVLPKANRTVSAWTCASRSQLWFAREDWKTACSVAAVRLRETHFLRVRKSTWTSRSPALRRQDSAPRRALASQHRGSVALEQPDHPHVHLPSAHHGSVSVRHDEPSSSPRTRPWTPRLCPCGNLSAGGSVPVRALRHHQASRVSFGVPSCKGLNRTHLFCRTLHVSTPAPCTPQSRGPTRNSLCGVAIMRGLATSLGRARPVGCPQSSWTWARRRCPPCTTSFSCNLLATTKNAVEANWMWTSCVTDVTQLLHWASAVALRQWSINLSLFTHSALILSQTRVPHTPCTPPLDHPPTWDKTTEFRCFAQVMWPKSVRPKSVPTSNVKLGMDVRLDKVGHNPPTTLQDLGLSTITELIWISIQCLAQWLYFNPTSQMVDNSCFRPEHSLQ